MNSQLKSRPSTIVWGAILAAVAAIAILATTQSLDVTGPSTVLWLVIGIGGLLVLGAVVGGIVRAVRGASTGSASGASTGSASGAGEADVTDTSWPFGEDASTGSASAEHQPID